MITPTITIFRAGHAIINVAVTQNSRRTFLLMQEDCITLQFGVPCTDVPIFKIGDYADYDGVRYYINEAVTPTYNETAGSYDFNIKLVAKYRTWSNVLMKSVKQPSAMTLAFGETKWDYTAQLREHATAILRCIALHEGRAVDETKLPKLVVLDANEAFGQYKHIRYDATNVLDALNALCAEDMFDCEWWVEPAGDEYQLHFGRMGANAVPSYTIETGVNAVISREASQNAYFNRLYAFGGTQNVPYSYRKDVIFTNSREDGNLWDDARQLTPAMINAPKVYITEGSKSINPVSETFTNNICAPRSESVTIQISGFPAGKYKVNLSRLAASVKMRFNKSGWIIRPKCEFFISTRHANVYAGGQVAVAETKLLQYMRYEGVYMGFDYTAKFDNDVELAFDGKASAFSETEINEIKITLVVSFEVDSSINMPPYTAEATIDVDASSDFLQRVDIEDIPVTITLRETGVSHAGFYHEDYSGTHLYINGASVAKNAQYSVSPLISTEVEDNMYTSDIGEDVINGLAEMRLRLPAGTATTAKGYVSHNGYIETAGAARGAETIVENSMLFEDIYPSIVNMPITKVEPYEEGKAETTFNDGTSSVRYYKRFRIYAKITDTDGTEHDFKEVYMLKNEQALRIKFVGEGNALCGMEFEVIFDEDTQSYIIIPNSNYGVLLPNDNLQPAQGDKIILLGWDTTCIPALGMTAEAEQRLLEAAAECLEKAAEGSSTYKAKMLPNTSDVFAQLVDASGEPLVDAADDFLVSDDVDNEPTIAIGAGVQLKDNALFDGDHTSNAMRVIGVDAQLDIPWDAPTYTIGEIPKPSRIRTLENKIK